jgi:hypothetical protein
MDKRIPVGLKGGKPHIIVGQEIFLDFFLSISFHLRPPDTLGRISFENAL